MLHTGLGPESAVSGFMTQVIACAIQLGGMPVPVGGGVRLVDALAGIVRDAGGELRTGAEVERIVVTDGRATGVVLADGETIDAARAVVAGVTPTQLYGRLLRPADAPDDVREAAARYRYGRAGMQIHIAMSEPPRWKGPDAERLGRTAIVHVTPGLDGVSRAVNEAERGLLPAEATIVAGQPCAVDPSRAPEGSWIVWIQLQELPAGRVKGDAAGELDVGDGTWTEELREAYADRIVARLGESIENLASATLERVVLSPADLEALNPNLVRGDIYAGSCALDQNLLWRPLASSPGHATAVDRLWHVGRQHPSGSWARRRLRISRREGADAAAPAPTAHCTTSRTLVVKLSLSTISTVSASFAEDVDAYAAAGFDAIGLWEMKLPDDDAANVESLHASGLGVSNCVPTVPSFLQLAIPGMEGPADPEERADAICASIRRLAAYEPECVLCLSGPLGGRSPDEGRAIVADGLERAARAARDAGVRLGFEPINPAQHDTAGFVCSLADALGAARRGGPRRRRNHGGHVQPRGGGSRRHRRGRAAADRPPRRGRPAGRDARCPRAARTRARPRSSARSGRSGGTARSTSRSSRHPTRSGRFPSTRRPAAPMPPSRRCCDGGSGHRDDSARGPRHALGLRQPAESERRFAALLDRRRSGAGRSAPRRGTDTGRPRTGASTPVRRRACDARRGAAGASARATRAAESGSCSSAAVSTGRRRQEGLGRDSFREAWDLARAVGDDGLAVDAAHMLGIVEPADEGAAWNERAMELARASLDPAARRWVGSLASNMGWARHEVGDFDGAIELFRLARDEWLADGRVSRARIARWSIARCLRSQTDFQGALAEQQALLAELEELGETDGYVLEEIAECLLALGRSDEARPFFAAAYAELSGDLNLRADEPERLERLRALGSQ